jgi:hypothetical protein
LLPALELVPGQHVTLPPILKQREQTVGNRIVWAIVQFSAGKLSGNQEAGEGEDRPGVTLPEAAKNRFRRFQSISRERTRQ